MYAVCFLHRQFNLLVLLFQTLGNPKAKKLSNFFWQPLAVYDRCKEIRVCFLWVVCSCEIKQKRKKFISRTVAARSLTKNRLTRNEACGLVQSHIEEAEPT